MITKSKSESARNTTPAIGQRCVVPGASAARRRRRPSDPGVPGAAPPLRPVNTCDCEYNPMIGKHRKSSCRPRKSSWTTSSPLRFPIQCGLRESMEDGVLFAERQEATVVVVALFQHADVGEQALRFQLGHQFHVAVAPVRFHRHLCRRRVLVPAADNSVSIPQSLATHAVIMSKLDLLAIFGLREFIEGL